MENPTYLKKAKLRDFQDCMEKIAPVVYRGEFDRAFEILDEFQIGPKTVNPRGRTFAFWLIEAQSVDGRSDTKKKREKFFEFSKLFVDRGVELDHQDKYGLTLLNFAVWNACGDFSLFLIERGASVDILDVHKLTPLAYAVLFTYMWNGEPEIMEETLKTGVTVVPALLRAGANPYLPYPTREEAQMNQDLNWILDEEKEYGALFTNLMEEVTALSMRKGQRPKLKAHFKLFMETVEEIRNLK